GRFLRVNHSLCEMVGRHEEDLLRTDFQAITHPEDLDPYLAFVRRMISGDIPSYKMEKRYVDADGHLVWILLSVQLARDPQVRPLYILSQIQDIRARKRAEADLLLAKEAAEAASRAKGEFLA